MPKLLDPKREVFAQALLRNIARGMARGKAATAAAQEAGYRGRALADNARKLANNSSVKARMVELAAPVQAALEAELTVDLERAERRLGEIILADVDLTAVKVPDVIAAIKQLSAMRAWESGPRESRSETNIFNFLSIEDQRVLADALEAGTQQQLRGEGGVPNIIARHGSERAENGQNIESFQGANEAHGCPDDTK